jgi:hypothetical protein
VAAIPGASSVEQLESNVAAGEIELTEDEYRAMSRASAEFAPAAVKDAPRHRNRSTIRHDLASLKHLSKGGVLLTQTARHDRKVKHIPTESARNTE